MPITKMVFSGSSGGRSVALGTGPTIIHTSVSGGSDYDELFFYVYNSATVARRVSAFVGATLAKDKISQSIPSQDGLYLVGPGAPLGLGKALKALATAGANVLYAHGWANRIVQ